MSQFKVALVVGSLRKESFNARLATAIQSLAPGELAFERLQIHDLPLYNQDDDASPAPAVKRIKQPEVFLQATDGFFDDKGGFANDSTRKFLQDWMKRYVAWIRKHAA